MLTVVAVYLFMLIAFIIRDICIAPAARGPPRDRGREKEGQRERGGKERDRRRQGEGQKERLGEKRP